MNSAFGIENKTINLVVNSTGVDPEIYNILSNATTDIPAVVSLTLENGDNILSSLESIQTKLLELESKGYNIELAYNITSTSEAEGTYDVTLNDQGTVETLTNLAQALTNLNTQAAALKDSANAIETTGPDNVKTLKEQMNNLTDKSVAVGNTADAIARLDSKSITATVTVRVNAPRPTPGSQTSTTVVMASAKGNVALAKGIQGSALAKGKTLMGELGPELVVSNGRYFTVGNNGAEFVDLPSDAIVFNHLQTKKLLGSGGMVGTGEPVTNERNAVALAGGNVTGPAMASAQEALDQLREIRVMWQGLLNMSASDFGRKAGLGSGGSGGGGGQGDNSAYIHDLERWYNLLRQIEKLEQQITLEQAKRANMRSGYDINRSLEKELELLEKQRDINKELAEQQKKYYEERRAILNSTDYSKIFTYDEDGLMQYVEGEGRGLDILATLNATDANGRALMNSNQQLAYLESIGFDTSTLRINADGTRAETAEEQMQNFWNGIDSWTEEMDSLYDSYNDAAIAMEEATSAMNEILQEQIDNQIAVEEKLMKALEAREQAEIDRIQEEKDALEEAAQEYIDGLNAALDKERLMYDKNETEAETSRLQRQLAILQRSGGSASEIRALQDQIDSRLKDAYFEEQQSQIDAIQEASDNQLEKLQTQIDIMTEALEYQKENGLLWAEISEMMQTWTPEALLQFIIDNDPDYQQNSATQNQEAAEETLTQLEQQAAYQEQQQENAEREAAWQRYFDSENNYSSDVKEKHKAKAKEIFEEEYKKSKDYEKAAAAARAYYESMVTSESNENDTSADSSTTGVGKVQTRGSNLNVRTGPGTNYEKIGKLRNQSEVILTGYKNKWYEIEYNGTKGYVYEDYIKTNDKNKLLKFAKGGLVDFTGPAWVDGSKSRPEAFLSAEDTAMLKSKIFSNSDGSLKALVAALEAITSNTSKYSAPEASSSIIIQNAQVNIQPGTISNDYDARRAGEMALEEMVKIARKTTNRVVSR